MKRILILVAFLGRFTAQAQSDTSAISVDLTILPYTGVIPRSIWNLYDSIAIKYADISFDVNRIKLGIRFVLGNDFKVTTHSKYDVELEIGRDFIKKSYAFKSNKWAYIFSQNYQSTCDYCIHFDWEGNDFWVEPDGRVFWNKKLIQKDFNIYINLIEYLGYLGK